MKVYSHFNLNELPSGLFSDDSPLQFHNGYALFFKKYHGNEIEIFYSEKLDAYIPIRHFKVKVFHFGQILHAPIRNNIELSADDQQLFFEELVDFLRKEQKIERLIQPHPSGIIQAVPHGAKSCPFGSYITQLDEVEEDHLLTKFDTKYRKSVNHAEKNGAIVKFGWNCFNDFYNLYKQTTVRAGIHCDPERYFQTLHDCIGDDHFEIGVVYDDDQPIGSLLVIYTRYAGLCTHAGSGGESKLYGGMKMLHHEMMKRLKKKGVRMYDFVGVRINSNNESLEGIFKFKKGFGGELKSGYLWKMDIIQTRTKMYDLMMRIRHRSGNVKDIIDEESN